MALDDAIAYYRRRKRMQSKELAKRLAVSSPWISQIERGKRHPTVKMLRSISIILQVDVSTLLFEASGEKDKDLFAKCKPLFDEMINLLLAADHRK